MSMLIINMGKVHVHITAAFVQTCVSNETARSPATRARATPMQLCDARFARVHAASV